MQDISDDQLIEELRFRLDQSRKSLRDLSVVNRKLVEMNRRLEESETLKSNFLSNIRNEINNPLNAIIGLAGQLSAMVRKPEVSELVSLIFSEAFTLDFQLRNIFMAAELEAGEAEPNIEHVDVGSVVARVLDNFSIQAAGKRVSLRSVPDVAATAEPLFFPTDAQMLQVILANLVANAVEYSTDGSEVLVCFGAADASLHLQVQDQGLGIAPNDLSRIFDRFTQLDQGSTRAHHGHGLGLSVVRSLLDLLQGRIEVSSTPGQGSLFRLTIPPASYDAEEGITLAEGGNLFLFDRLEEK